MVIRHRRPALPLQPAFLLSVLATATLTLLPADPARSAFSGTSAAIAFQSSRDGNDEIYVMNADGSDQTRLTNNAASDGQPAWSPDGTMIAFTSDRDGNDEIYVMDADGGNQVPITVNPASDSNPAWSVDGTQIWFTSDRDGNNEIYLMTALGAGQTQVPVGSASDSQPDTSPNGSQIVFQSDGFGELDIFVMDTNGSNLTRLTNNAGNDAQPAWSPAGSQIAYTSDRDGARTEIYIMKADGSEQTRLTNSAEAVDNSEPAWQRIPPPNDAQGDAESVGEGQQTGTLILATPDGTSSCGAGNGQPDIWYLYTAPGAGTLRADTCGTNDIGGWDAGTDTILSLHTGDGLTEHGCNDDWIDSPAENAACPADNATPRDSYIEKPVVAGEQVLIRVTRYPDEIPAGNILLNLVFDPDITAPDTDGDGVPDSSDNCTLVPNASQCDSDGDSFGNHCDGDLNNNTFTNAQDYIVFRAQLGQASEAPTYNQADLNCNGFVNAQDYVLFRQLLGSPPGPSGLAVP